MRKVCFMAFILFAADVFCELPILQTTFRKATQELVVQYAEQDNAEAQMELALRNYAGYQVPKNASNAFLWMRKSAEQKHPDALELLSQMYAEGIGVPTNSQKAELWFIAALVQSPDDSRLKKQFERWVNEKKELGGTADDFLRKCADAGYTPAYIPAYDPLATAFYSNGSYKEALPLLIKLSGVGDVVSTLRLAEMYMKGLGGLSQDDVQARVLYRQVANQGDAKAQCELAVMVEQGVGGDPDPVQAESWYQRSADQGNVDAQNRLAEIESARFPYELRAIKDLYPKSKARQKIVSVRKNTGKYQNIAGEKVPGLSIRYKRPSTLRAAGFSGIVLVGVELVNRKIGDRYWFLGTYLDDEPTYEYPCDSDLDLFVDQDLDHDVAITGWAVVYGHLLSDKRTVAVFDTREFNAGSLAELLERNRYSTVLANKMVARTLPQSNMGGDLTGLEPVPEAAPEAPDEEDDDESLWDLLNPFN